MAELRTLAILGSTGSIGRQAIDIATRFPERVRVVALSANTNVDSLVEQATRLGVTTVALADRTTAAEATASLPDATVLAGDEGVVEAARSADIVLNALVGAAGLRATIAALESGATLALANKESLVVGGEIVTALVDEDNLVPVDSEHSALFQCLLGEPPASVERLWLTASGGPFRGCSRGDLENATVKDALAHPRWDMGPKISIDSATLMNKGLEVIEAHHLFDMPYERISVVVHPQSSIHSMIEFSDGSVKAHLGPTDMRIPIQYALSHPDRWEAPLPPVDFTQAEGLSFEPPDLDTFRCLALAFAAGRAGGTMPATLNAANEEAVASFLDGHIPLTGIDRTVAAVMEEHDPGPVASLEHIEAVDHWARTRARELLVQEASR